MQGDKQKYIRLKRWDTIIIFPELLNHSDFKHFNILSAGFCIVSDSEVECYGESISLKLKSDKKDSEIATKQIFGVEGWIEFMMAHNKTI